MTRTLDGGETWSSVSLPADLASWAVSFADTETGWVGGEFRRMYRTTNGGDTWEGQEIGEGSDAVTALAARGRDHAVAVTSHGAILVTEDGGETWEEEVAPGINPWLTGVSYDDSGYAYAVGFRGIVVRARMR